MGQPEAKVPPPTPRPKVLCLDDDPQISQLIKFRLERYGVDVSRAFDGMTGFWTALETQPDVIICDMVMPNGEGNYMLCRFRDHSLTKDVPIIILTGQQNPALKRQMLALGVAAYLTKPLKFDELLHELAQFIRIEPSLATARTDSPGLGLYKD